MMAIICLLVVCLSVTVFLLKDQIFPKEGGKTQRYISDDKMHI